ncbi:hypothetical protein [Streptomyces sp. TS71-3]|uniref:hypothetical protein n=1 Tax=Streptomyces sp. TS71-3 TaxID=2733862 RepID=UPI001B1D14CA|nr:hypothetical protein [Streptomyces sp. TS71-3]GHJ36778.1 hypothetical protein Sm713_23870 [Streptomyces sp. TS71-3]
MSKSKSTSVAASFPLIIGVVVAAAAITQDNWGGAVLGLVAGVVISLVLSMMARRRKR